MVFPLSLILHYILCASFSFSRTQCDCCPRCWTCVELLSRHYDCAARNSLPTHSIALNRAKVAVGDWVFWHLAQDTGDDGYASCIFFCVHMNSEVACQHPNTLKFSIARSLILSLTHIHHTLSRSLRSEGWLQCVSSPALHKTGLQLFDNGTLAGRCNLQFALLSMHVLHK